ncbi:hypothetical protein ABXT70_13825 [Candidatus Njordibacter sp. Uisw_039]|uniref:hypothetical protein n=1 Tax=Candidatus Njordibacter sp. Uisw_039 TaxID=3230972 RepID=UPI003D4E5743
MTFIIKDPKAESFNYTLDSSSVELTALVDKLFEEIKLNRHKVHKNGLKLILLNLIVHKGSKVLISRDNNSKRLARYNALDVGGTAIKTVTDKLEKSEYIHFITGKNLPYGHGIRSSIQATDSLNTLLKPITLQLTPSELVLIREGGSKKLIDYTDTPRTLRIRKELTAYNELLESVNIELRDLSGLTVLKDLNHQVVQRKFIDNGEVDSQGQPLFNSGGRSSAAWTSMSGSDERPNIFIDGQKTVELDYQASAINIIYKALTGVVYAGDPYTISVGNVLIPRHLVKQIATTSLNSNTVEGNSSAIGNAYGELGSSLKAEDKLKFSQYKDIKKKITIKDILEAFLTKHYLIRHMFLRGQEVGNRVQCLESDLVFAVVNELTKKSIPTLTVHDSFIVKAADKATLDTLMTTTGFPDQDLVKGLI